MGFTCRYSMYGCAVQPAQPVKCWAPLGPGKPKKPLGAAKCTAALYILGLSGTCGSLHYLQKASDLNFIFTCVTMLPQVLFT